MVNFVSANQFLGIEKPVQLQHRKRKFPRPACTAWLTRTSIKLLHCLTHFNVFNLNCICAKFFNQPYETFPYLGDRLLKIKGTTELFCALSI
jgi:hypothetical protein